MSDPLRDEQFPDRPQHQDFWDMSEIVLFLDGEITEGHRHAEDVISEMVDFDSTIYMLKQRLRRMWGEGYEPGLTSTAAAWMDGFIIGMKLGQKKERKERS